MISNISSNYNAICKLFNFGKESTADLCKRTLIEMAEKGQDRPKQKTKIGQRLCSYTSRSSGSFDEKFYKKIKKIRPDWLVTAEERMANNKKMFLEMAARGKKRPNKKKDPMGAIFSSYVSPSQPTFDKKFRNDIKKIRPDWIERKKDIRKIELIKYAKKNKSKPHWKSPIGKSFAESVYRKNRKGFDINLYNQLKELRPNWFISSRQIAEKTKSEILKLAKNKLITLRQIKQKIKTFPDYVRSRSVDKTFINKLKKLRPDFFITRSDIAKKEKEKILNFARKNIDLKWSKEEKGKFYQWLLSDKKFREEILRLSPSWYSPKYKITQKVEKAKKKIINMAKFKQPRPTSKTYEGRLLTNLTSKSKRYNVEFHKKLKKLRPDWFKK